MYKTKNKCFNEIPMQALQCAPHLHPLETILRPVTTLYNFFVFLDLAAYPALRLLQCAPHLHPLETILRPVTTLYNFFVFLDLGYTLLLNKKWFVAKLFGEDRNFFCTFVNCFSLFFQVKIRVFFDWSKHFLTFPCFSNSKKYLKNGKKNFSFFFQA